MTAQSLLLSEGRETDQKKKKKKRSCPSPMAPWIYLPFFHPQEKQTPISLLSSLGTPFLCPRMKLPLILATPVILKGCWPLVSQPDSQLAHHQTVNPLSQHGHWSASWPAPTHSLASSLESHLVDQLANKPTRPSPKSIAHPFLTPLAPLPSFPSTS